MHSTQRDFAFESQVPLRPRRSAMAAWAFRAFSVSLMGIAPASGAEHATAVVDDACTPFVSDDVGMAVIEKNRSDWADVCHYRAANSALAGKPRPQVVLMGDSISEGWAKADPSLFGTGIVDRGISGQTTPQMVLRFYSDVIALHPRAVHIMAGINDFAGNKGPTTEQDIRNNFLAMIDLAQKNGIQVMLASILPADHMSWVAGAKPAQEISTFNRWLRELSVQRQLVYIDYYSAMATDSGAMRAEFSEDGLHPNARGYATMRPIFEKAVAATLKSPRNPLR